MSYHVFFFSINFMNYKTKEKHLEINEMRFISVPKCQVR